MFSFQPQYVSMSYVIEYTSESEALAMYKQCRNKVSKLDANKNYILTIGRRMRTKSETMIGTRLSFLASLDKKTVDESPEKIDALEKEVMGSTGTIVSKIVV